VKGLLDDDNRNVRKEFQEDTMMKFVAVNDYLSLQDAI
jgi:hypothetical protein